MNHEAAMHRRTLLAAGGATLAVGPSVLGAAMASDLDALRARLSGKLITAGDPAYEGARRTRSFNPETVKRPLAIALCASHDDVRRALDFAVARRVEVAVRAGGHDVLGASTVDGGLVIDLAPMASIEIDPARRSARIGAGVISGAFNRAAGAHGLAPVLGCHPGVGVAGLTLGGGIGWLAGAHGATCDQLVGAELVTADCARLSADADTRPELFWALRGGGGNFGVATSLEFRLVPMAPIYGGTIAYRIGERGALANLLGQYRELMAEAPDELVVELSLSTSGGAPIALALVCWSGRPERGSEAIAPLRRATAPLFEQMGVVPFARLAGGAPPLPANLFWRGASLDRLNDAAIAGLEEAVRRAPPGWSIGLGHVMHGRIAAPEAHTAFPRQAGKLAYFVNAGWPDGMSGAAGMAWVRETMSALAAASSASTYVNYLSDDAEPAVALAYGDRFARLRQIKRRYDPDNVFRHDRNIPPC
jgi:FAD/FMN-containing dehydrogenase